MTAITSVSGWIKLCIVLDFVVICDMNIKLFMNGIKTHKSHLIFDKFARAKVEWTWADWKFIVKPPESIFVLKQTVCTTQSLGKIISLLKFLWKLWVIKVWLD